MKNYLDLSELKRWHRKEKIEKCKGLDLGGGTPAKPGIPSDKLSLQQACQVENTIISIFQGKGWRNKEIK